MNHFLRTHIIIVIDAVVLGLATACSYWPNALLAACDPIFCNQTFALLIKL